MENIITADTILDFLVSAVESKRMLNPELWLDSAAKLNVLIGKERITLEDMRQVVAKKKLEYLTSTEKRNVSEAKLRVEATDEYRDMKKQEAKCDQIEEFIRVAKIQARSAQGF